MVTGAELAIELVKWVALFIPALAIMLNTLSNVYDESLLETIGIADARRKQVMKISTIAFIFAFLALILSLLYLLTILNILNDLSISGAILVLATVCIFGSVGITTLILVDFYRASSAITIDPTELEELAESDPETAIHLLNMAGALKQISQPELDLIANAIDLEEKWKQEQHENSESK